MRGLKTILIIVFALIASVTIVFLTTKVNITLGLAISLAPIGFIFAMLILFHPFYGYMFAFILNYFNAGISRYVQGYSPGIVFDFLLVFILFSLLVNTLNKKVDWKQGVNIGTSLSLIWVIYCFFQFFNPNATSNEAWFTTVRGLGFYFFIIILYTSIICNNWKKVKTVLLVWGVLALLGAAKGVAQRYLGFDDQETVWLFRDGGALTHIIFSGIRYFSFFSDASSFGGTMGQSAAVFLILSIFEKETRRRIFYIIVSVASIYGLTLSGTRSAFVIPIVSITVFIFLSKNIKTIIIFSLVLISSVIFFRFTYIGQGNATIRRVRSTFYATEDASFLVRLENQKKLKVYLKDKPFGAGIGHGGVKAYRLTHSQLATIPTDSWYVMIWVETGIVGLVLNILIMLTLVGYGIYLVIFKIKDKEIRVTMGALISGVTGIIVASYGNEILGQFPTGFIVYSSLGFVIMGKIYDKEISEQNRVVVHND